jgi:hypothetical protein
LSQNLMQSLKKMGLKITIDKSVEGVQHPIIQHIRCAALRDLAFFGRQRRICSERLYATSFRQVGGIK